MDNLTHTLVAVTLTRTPLGRAGPGATAALILGSNAPDVDVISLLGGRLSYLEWHRGPTHGILGAPLLALATACVIWAGARFLAGRRDRATSTTAANPGRASFGMLITLSLIGALLHVLMDLCTSYGTRLLSPFSWQWLSADWLPIIDIYLLGMLVTGLIVSALSPRSRRHAAATALVLLIVNYGLRAAAHREALALAPQLFGSLLPAACVPGAPLAQTSLLDAWPRTHGGITVTDKPCLVELAAMPTFTSPFRWRIVARLSNSYELHDIDLLDSRFRQSDSGQEVFWRATVRVPDVWTPAVMQAATTSTGRIFLGFSRFPAARSSVNARGEAIVRWNDMRFAGGILDLSAPRRPDPFTVIVRLAADGRVLQQQLGP